MLPDYMRGDEEATLVPDPSQRPGCWLHPKSGDVVSMPVDWRPKGMANASGLVGKKVDIIVGRFAGKVGIVRHNGLADDPPTGLRVRVTETGDEIPFESFEPYLRLRVDNKGDGAVVAGGDVSGSIIISGSGNTVNVGGRPPATVRHEPASTPVQTVDTPIDERTPTVFVSYSHDDDDFVERLISDLNRMGHAVWVDTSSIKGGDDWLRAIAEGIVNSYAFIIVATKSSLASKWVRDEVTWAKQQEKLIVPVLVEDVVRDTAFFPLVNFHGVKFHGVDYGTAIVRLVASLPTPGKNDTSATRPAEMWLPSIETVRLVATINGRLASIKDRVAAGRRLAEIGDPRPGVGLRADGLPDIVWCDVSASEFTFAGDPQAPDSGPPRQIDLPAFRICKYPVTYCQFQAFVDAEDGYANAQWWDGLHSDGLVQQRKGPGEQRFRFTNYPRENVSWYDAMAFCRWLSAMFGDQVCLPTEQQWEKAARGTDGRAFPYGNEFDPTKCNSGNSGIGQTSAVGAFPGGASPYGAMDMSGDVWEWTLTEFYNGSDANISSCDRRVLRGGTWGNNAAFARAAYRNDLKPSHREVSVGFRVTCPAV